MKSLTIKNRSVSTLIVFIQVMGLFVYLAANISNVGDMGTALPVLILSVTFSALLIFVMMLKETLYIRFHLLLFLLIVVWVGFRIIIDTQDVSYLKQTTVATTGGILLFYMIGSCLSVGVKHVILQSGKVGLIKSIFLLTAIILLWILFDFSQRLRDNIFLISDVDGAYQRPGNFLSIIFITLSFFYMVLSLKVTVQKGGVLGRFVWFLAYTVCAFIALVTSQMIGSNSATAIVLGVYLMTLVTVFISTDNVVLKSYQKGDLALPFSKKLTNRLLVTSVSGLLIFISLLAVLVYVTSFDLTSLRLFGFGEGGNNSIQSRIDILLKVGVKQLEYAPLLGNYNVAFLTTGLEGKRLHSLLPFVMANLGLVGLIAVSAFFFLIFRQLLRESAPKRLRDVFSYQNNIFSLFSFFVLGYVFIFANIATGISWAVLWFVVGFVSVPIGFKK